MTIKLVGSMNRLQRVAFSEISVSAFLSAVASNGDIIQFFVAGAERGAAVGLTTGMAMAALLQHAVSQIKNRSGDGGLKRIQENMTWFEDMCLERQQSRAAPSPHKRGLSRLTTLSFTSPADNEFTTALCRFFAAVRVSDVLKTCEIVEDPLFPQYYEKKLSVGKYCDQMAFKEDAEWVKTLAAITGGPIHIPYQGGRSQNKITSTFMLRMVLDPTKFGALRTRDVRDSIINLLSTPNRLPAVISKDGIECVFEITPTTAAEDPVVIRVHIHLVRTSNSKAWEMKTVDDSTKRRATAPNEHLQRHRLTTLKNVVLRSVIGSSDTSRTLTSIVPTVAFSSGGNRLVELLSDNAATEAITRSGNVVRVRVDPLKYGQHIEYAKGDAMTTGMKNVLTKLVAGVEKPMSCTTRLLKRHGGSFECVEEPTLLIGPTLKKELVFSFKADEVPAEDFVRTLQRHVVTASQTKTRATPMQGVEADLRRYENAECVTGTVTGVHLVALSVDWTASLTLASASPTPDHLDLFLSSLKTDNPADMFAMYGIESARNAIYDHFETTTGKRPEQRKTDPWLWLDENPDIRLLANRMTYGATVDSHIIQKKSSNESSPFLQAAHQPNAESRQKGKNAFNIKKIIINGAKAGVYTCLGNSMVCNLMFGLVPSLGQSHVTITKSKNYSYTAVVPKEDSDSDDEDENPPGAAPVARVPTALDSDDEDENPPGAVTVARVPTAPDSGDEDERPYAAATAAQAQTVVGSDDEDEPPHGAATAAQAQTVVGSDDEDEPPHGAAPVAQAQTVVGSDSGEGSNKPRQLRRLQRPSCLAETTPVTRQSALSKEMLEDDDDDVGQHIGTVIDSDDDPDEDNAFIDDQSFSEQSFNSEYSFDQIFGQTMCDGLTSGDEEDCRSFSEESEEIGRHRLLDTEAGVDED